MFISMNSGNRIKIFVIDTWLGGIKNYEKLKLILDEKYYEIRLIHTESFNHNNLKKTKINDTLDLKIDCNYFFLHNFLKREMPNYVIIFNFHSLITQSAILSCKSLKIQTIFLMPGIRETDVNYIKNEEYNLKFSNLNQKRSIKIVKYIRYLIPNFLYSSIFFRGNKIKVIMYAIFRLLSIAFNPGRNLFYTKTINEFYPDKFLVFSDFYKKHFIDYYDIPNKHISVIGNLDLDEEVNKVSVKEKKIIDEKINKIKFAVYLPSPFKEAGYSFWTEKKFKTFVSNLIDALENIQMKLVIKLHPSMDLKYYEKLLDGFDVRLIKVNNGLKEILSKSEFSICHTSSAILASAILSKDTFIPRWNEYGSLRDRFSQYGITIPISSFNEMINIFKLGNLNKHNDKIKHEIIGPVDGHLKKRLISHLN